MIFLDLYLTLYNPFYPRESRVWKYYVTLIFSSFFVLGYIVYQIISGLEITKYFETGYVAWILFAPPFLVSIISSFLVLLRLCKRGTSKKLRIIVFRRHLIYMMLYIGIFFTLGNNPISRIVVEPSWKPLLKVLFAPTGILLFLSRVTEPFVYQNIS